MTDRFSPTEALREILAMLDKEAAHTDYAEDVYQWPPEPIDEPPEHEAVRKLREVMGSMTGESEPPGPFRGATWEGIIEACPYPLERRPYRWAGDPRAVAWASGFEAGGWAVLIAEEESETSAGAALARIRGIMERCGEAVLRLGSSGRLQPGDGEMSEARLLLRIGSPDSGQTIVVSGQPSAAHAARGLIWAAMEIAGVLGETEAPKSPGPTEADPPLKCEACGRPDWIMAPDTRSRTLRCLVCGFTWAAQDAPVAPVPKQPSTDRHRREELEDLARKWEAEDEAGEERRARVLPESTMTPPELPPWRTVRRPGDKAGAERLAEMFHESYERLAPGFAYETRPASAKPWAEVPENNRRLMIAVCEELLAGPVMLRGGPSGTADGAQERIAAPESAQPAPEGAEARRSGPVGSGGHGRFEDPADAPRAADGGPPDGWLYEVQAKPGSIWYCMALDARHPSWRQATGWRHARPVYRLGNAPADAAGLTPPPPSPTLAP